MGAKDLVWRIGGTGDGAADRGRDIEATFHAATPDGGLESQRWWIEARGRKGTVEAAGVKTAVLSRGDVDVLVIATNTQFSNNTRDWIEDWQRNHPRPRVRLWDRNTLERMLLEHPSVAARLFEKALSNQARLDVLRTRFWNSGVFASGEELARFWNLRTELDFGYDDVVSLLACEHANGDTHTRPWLSCFAQDEILNLLRFAIANYLPLYVRAEDRGTPTGPITEALASLFITSLLTYSTRDVIGAALRPARKEFFPEEGVNILLQPVMETIAYNMGLACAADCERVTADSVGSNGRNDPSTYWDRFLPTRNAEMNITSSGLLIVKDGKKPCKIGFPLSTAVYCPLFRDHGRRSLREYVEVFKAVSDFRIAQRRPKHHS